MSALLLLLLLDFALVAAAAVLLLVVIIQRGRTPQYLLLAALLLALALGVWYTAIRTPPALPCPARGDTCSVFTRDEVRLTTLSNCAG